MPELPEVETVKRGLEPVLQGRILTTLNLNRPNLRYPFPDTLQNDLEGQLINRLSRRGKYICIDFDNGKTLIVHLGMSGSFAINPSAHKPHDHVIFETNDGDVIHYNDPRRFGFMLLSNTTDIHTHSAFAKMGVEPLSNDLNAAYVFEKLKNKQTPIKTALLDQSIIAGIGNIYACEALYMTSISPLRPSSSLLMTEIENLVIAVRDVLISAIESGGSTLRDHRQADGKMGYFQHRFKVYDREGTNCPETNDKIIRIAQSGRSTFYCPAKQV